ncbi:hypothetical protein F0U60_05330 [Archangium minus]|uniref:Uncharacterized protein n=1 Tax=Archangium minus TaxID=83450 RepID=A0ABY9WIH4_9BACT|nr:hypothetical protein F0U60_05330 [Archangium minus]
MPNDFQDPYEKDSIYFVAQHALNQQVVGVCRLVLQELRTLPTYNHFELFEHERRALERWKPGTYCEMGALAKLPNHSNVTPGLVAVAMTRASAMGMTHVLCCSDQRLFQSTQQHLGIPYQVIGRSRLFYGSVKIPCIVNISETLRQLERRRPRMIQDLALHTAASTHVPPPLELRA